MLYFVVALICVKISFSNVTDHRKHYGLSFYSNCGDYVKTFKCMTACKSIGYQVFRLNSLCKCSCHEMKTSTVLPYFKWKTNGTTMKIPKTFSPRLYHVVGTLSPRTLTNSTEETTSSGGVYKDANTTSPCGATNNTFTTESVTGTGSNNETTNVNVTESETTTVS